MLEAAEDDGREGKQRRCEASLDRNKKARGSPRCDFPLLSSCWASRLIVISPYAKPGYVSSTQYEFSSVLKFIEERFNLPALTSRDAEANDMTDSFNFGQQPLSPLVLQQRTCPIISATGGITFGGQAVNTRSSAFAVTLTNIRTADITEA